MLARTPGFTITVVLTLALGIGATSTVFSAINAVLLQPLTFPDAGRLVVVDESRPNAPTSNTAPVRLEEWNEQNSTFEAISGYYREDVSETSGDLPERFRRAYVAPRFLDVWGTKPQIGRGFEPEESQPGAVPVVLVSHRYWTTRLESDPNVLDRQVRIGDQSLQIIGVMPESFRFPDRNVDFFTPRTYEPFVLGRGNLWYRGIGRLKPGVSLEQARADLNLIQQRLREQYPDTDRGVGVYVAPLKETTVGDVRSSLLLLLGAVAVLLLIASTNIAALLLARAARREQEISVRMSLGASRSSISSEVFIETAVLAATAAFLGLIAAVGASAALRRLVPDFPRVDEIAVDGRILLFTFACIFAVTLLCGLAPAVRAARAGLAGTLMEGRRTQVSARHSPQWLFVGVQVALSVVLLDGAGLLIRSFQQLSRIDPGFEASQILSFRVGGTFVDFPALSARIDEILGQLRALPGVQDAAVSSPVPGMVDDDSGFQFGLVDLRVEGRDDTQEPAVAQVRNVSPNYFATMQIPLLSGELCEDAPSDPPPGTTFDIMVNESFASRYLPRGLSSVGAIVRPDPAVAYRVAGVVGDSREFALNREPVPTFYQCRTAFATPALAFLVRARGEPASITQAVRARIKELEPLRAVYDVAPLMERIGDEFAQDRLRTTALALFAGTALGLACLGIYGTLSYVVSLRRREVGLRVALGARQGNIVAQFLGKALRVVAAACVVGLSVSFGASRLLSGMLFGVSASDPVTLVAVIGLVTPVAVLAALLSSMRGTRVNPMQVLREE